MGVMGASQWALEAQDAAKDWKVVKDPQGVCQLTVPSDWVAGKTSASLVRSLDRRLNAAPASAAGKSFAQVAAAAKQTMPPTRILEDSPNRLWFSYIGLNPAGGANLFVAIAGNPVCTAQVTYKVPQAQEMAKKIALSLSVVPPKQ